MSTRELVALIKAILNNEDLARIGALNCSKSGGTTLEALDTLVNKLSKFTTNSIAKRLNAISLLKLHSADDSR